MTPPAVALQDAYAACLRLAHSHYENFPVASRLMPARLRPHVAAIYAFARIADDYADEPGREPDERLRLLDDWQERLHAAAAGREPRYEMPPDKSCPPDKQSPPDPPSRGRASTFAQSASADKSVGRPERSPDCVFPALADTIERFDLPLRLFEDLLSAFKQDVTTTRYETWAGVFDYCRRSANPVGRLVLRLSGYRDDQLDRASDAVCTALQLTNFWQDLAIDWSRGRLYVPQDTWRGHGADPSALDQGRMTAPWAATMRECGRHTRALFGEGRSVCDGVSGRLRYQLRATWLGGTRVLDRLEQSDFDVFTSRPRLGIADAIVIACGTALWHRAPFAP